LRLKICETCSLLLVLRVKELKNFVANGLPLLQHLRPYSKSKLELNSKKVELE